MEPEPERLGEPAEKVNLVNIKKALGKPVVERLICLAHVLREHWDDGHLSNLLYYPGNGLLPKILQKGPAFRKLYLARQPNLPSKASPGPPHQLVHVVPHLGLVGATRRQTHQVTLLEEGDEGLFAAHLTLRHVTF